MTNRKHLILALAAVLALSGALYGQASMTVTTLSTAISSPVPSASGVPVLITVASATGITGRDANGGITTGLLIDREYLEVISVSGTSVTVRRARRGTQAAAHPSGATVWAGLPRYFEDIDPSGACTATALPVLPRVVISTGSVWNCGNGLWTSFLNAGPYTIGAALASATTIAPTNPVHHVTGTTATATITVPPAMGLGPQTTCIQLIPDGLWTTTTAGNIVVATTAIAGKTIEFCYDFGTSKWYPSY